jgi:membrane protein implicated in regulation of membrane protease activity
MPAWVIWAILAVLLALGELATPGLFFLGPVALATLPALIVSFFAPAWVQVLVFIASALASLAILRPIARAHLKMPAITRTGTAALIGARALVLERVDVNGGACGSAERNGLRARTWRTRCSSRALASKSQRSRARPLSSMNRRTP